MSRLLVLLALVGLITPRPGGVAARELPPDISVPNEDGVVMMEVESVQPLGDWSEETALRGFSGDSYFRWAGPNLLDTPGADSILFRFLIDAPGAHFIRVRTQQNHENSLTDNDCWFRLDGGPWTQLLGFVVDAWNSDAILDTTMSVPFFDLAAGVHTVELSGRSSNFKIDRIDVIPESIFWPDPLADPGG